MSFDSHTLEQLKELYQEALQNKDIELLLLHGGAYFDRLRGGSMLSSDRDLLQHQILAIRAQAPISPPNP